MGDWLALHRMWGEARVGRILKDGEPCSHPGCLSHRSHPCEGCGRVGGQSARQDFNLFDKPVAFSQRCAGCDKDLGDETYLWKEGNKIINLCKVCYVRKTSKDPFADIPIVKLLSLFEIEVSCEWQTENITKIRNSRQKQEEIKAEIIKRTTY